MATPRPMPVLPSSSRLRMARTTSSASAARTWPASRRLSTIARMTASLVVAVSEGMIASRTTNSPRRMAGSLRSVLSGLVQAPAGGQVAGGGGAAVVLDAVFVAPQLALDLGEAQVHGGDDVVVGLGGDEVVLVLGLDQELDQGLVFLRLLQVQGDLDQGQAVEQVHQLVRLVADGLLVGLAEVPMSDGDLDLHGRDS